MNNRNCIRLAASDWALLLTLLKREGKAETNALAKEIKEKRKITLTERAYIGAAGGEDGELECDDDALVSTGEDPGAYVQVWQWVDNEAAGVFSEGDSVLVTPVAGDIPSHEFLGTVSGIFEDRGQLVYTVTDQEGDAFDMDGGCLKLNDE